MQKIRIFLRDFYRFYFNRIKIKSVRDVSIWKVPSFSVAEREERLILINKWLEKNRHINEVFHKRQKQHSKLNSAEITDAILLDTKDKEIIKNLFVLFNKRKFISQELSLSIKNISIKISLEAYCNLALVFLQEFKESGNIQFLNTSLKITDFLLFCQIITADDRYRGAISSVFPCGPGNFNVNFSVNKKFAEVISMELEFVKHL